LKRQSLLPPPVELGGGGAAATDAFIKDLKHHDLERIAIGERLQQNRVDHRKDGRIAGDSQRQRTDGGDSETGRPQEHARGVLQVPQESIHELWSKVSQPVCRALST
jgi:hypothetical protein